MEEKKKKYVKCLVYGSVFEMGGKRGRGNVGEFRGGIDRVGGGVFGCFGFFGVIC